LAQLVFPHPAKRQRRDGPRRTLISGLGGLQPNLCIWLRPPRGIAKAVIPGAVTEKRSIQFGSLRDAYDQATAFVSKFYQLSHSITTLRY
jgi:hypothetical protein